MSKKTVRKAAIRETLRLYQKSSTAGISPDREKNDLPSKTVPDESLTVREILERFTRGVLPPIGQDLVFTDDLEDLRGLEPWQISELIEENKEEIRRLETARNLDLLPPPTPEKKNPEVFEEEPKPKE